jgi:hypothetical protein
LQEQKEIPKILVITRRGNAYRVVQESNPEVWGAGENPENALLNLLQYHQKDLGLEILLDPQELRYRRPEREGAGAGKTNLKQVEVIKEREGYRAVLRVNSEISEIAGFGGDAKRAIVNLLEINKDTGIKIVFRNE